MKKKLIDMTIKEVIEFCKRHGEGKSCCDLCPLNKRKICVEENFCPPTWFYIEDEMGFEVETEEFE